MKRRGKSYWTLAPSSIQLDLRVVERRVNVLCGECLIVHEEEIDIASVVDEESLVAGGHHVASLLV